MANPNSSGTKLSLKVVINNDMSKVVFAEADNDFVDVLLSFLTLPLGKVVTNMGGINREPKQSARRFVEPQRVLFQRARRKADADESAAFVRSVLS